MVAGYIITSSPSQPDARLLSVKFAFQSAAVRHEEVECKRLLVRDSLLVTLVSIDLEKKLTLTLPTVFMIVLSNDIPFFFPCVLEYCVICFGMQCFYYTSLLCWWRDFVLSAHKIVKIVSSWLCIGDHKAGPVHVLMFVQ